MYLGIVRILFSFCVQFCILQNRELSDETQWFSKSFQQGFRKFPMSILVVIEGFQWHLDWKVDGEKWEYGIC